MNHRALPRYPGSVETPRHGRTQWSDKATWLAVSVVFAVLFSLLGWIAFELWPILKLIFAPYPGIA